jgi:hypothetical protein
LNTPSQREHAKRLIDRAEQGHVMRIEEETRNDRQNRALWGWIKAIREQDEDMARYTAEEVKLRFLNALGMEMRFLPALDGGGLFPVGHKSSVLTVDQFAALLTIMDEWAARHGIELPRNERLAA